MKRAVLTAICLVVLLPVIFIGAAAGVLDAGASTVIGSVSALAGVPGEYLRLFQAAGVAYQVPWQILAGIGKVECDDGQDPAPACNTPGAVNYAGAGGPMQFIASTWQQYGVSVGGGPPDRWNATDAIYTAARYLKANGAPTEIQRAIYAYNHSAEYVDEVLAWASAYEREANAAVPTASSGVTDRALAFALAARGTPYVWGGESPAGYDCSGLVQAAYRAAGVALPRTAQEQFDAGPHLPPGAQLQPGDLVFFGGGQGDITHVGIVLSADGEMVDAPHTGVVVRVESFPTVPGSAYGQDIYVGATRPAALGANR